MGDNKIVALIFLLLAGFLFWLHTQGKLIPLFQMLFGTGNGAVTTGAAQTSSAAPGPGIAPGTPLPTALLQVYQEWLKHQGMTGGSTGTAAPVTTSVPASGGADPAHDNPGVLPGFSSSLPGWGGH